MGAGIARLDAQQDGGGGHALRSPLDQHRHAGAQPSPGEEHPVGGEVRRGEAGGLLLADRVGQADQVDGGNRDQLGDGAAVGWFAQQAEVLADAGWGGKARGAALAGDDRVDHARLPGAGAPATPSPSVSTRPAASQPRIWGAVSGLDDTPRRVRRS